MCNERLCSGQWDLQDLEAIEREASEIFDVLDVPERLRRYPRPSRNIVRRQRRKKCRPPRPRSARRPCRRLGTETAAAGDVATRIMSSLSCRTTLSTVPVPVTTWATGITWTTRYTEEDTKHKVIVVVSGWCQLRRTFLISIWAAAAVGNCGNLVIALRVCACF